MSPLRLCHVISTCHAIAIAPKEEEGRYNRPNSTKHCHRVRTLFLLSLDSAGNSTPMAAPALVTIPLSGHFAIVRKRGINAICR